MTADHGITHGKVCGEISEIPSLDEQQIGKEEGGRQATS
jgi:hypothetical protein